MRTRDALAKQTNRPASVPVPNDKLRPSKLSDIVGQDDAKAEIHLAAMAANARGEALGHVLMSGPPGMGKTTFALAAFHEMAKQGDFIATTASLMNTDTLTRTLQTMKPYSMLFLDEIHGLTRKSYELIYGAMEDGHIDTTAPGSTERVQLPPFTVIGATTLPGRLEQPFKDRFDLQVRLTFYSLDEIEIILTGASQALGCMFEDEALAMIADRAKDTPRVALRLLKRVRDWAQVRGSQSGESCLILEQDATATFRLLGIDEMGLDKLDQRYMIQLLQRFKGGPIGVTRMAQALGEETDTLQSDIEPFLVRRNLIASTARGRIITAIGRQHTEDLVNAELTAVTDELG